jgi:hypothetical protein
MNASCQCRCGILSKEGVGEADGVAPQGAKPPKKLRRWITSRLHTFCERFLFVRKDPSRKQEGSNDTALRNPHCGRSYNIWKAIMTIKKLAY